MYKDEAAQKVILHLALPENLEKEFEFYKLLQQLGIPKDLGKSTFNTLFYNHHIDGPPTIKDPVIHITDKGKEYAKEIEETYFQTHGTPLNPLNTTKMSLEQTCELLYQMHKNNGFEIIWTKNTYDNQPDNLSTAREVMLKQGIIFPKSSTGKTMITLLNPDLFDIDSYKNALHILVDKKAVSNVITTNNYGNNAPITIAAGYQVEQKDLSINISNNDYQELERLGVEKAAIEELKVLVQQNSKDKATLKEKVLKWFGQVSASVASKGIAENIPTIFECVQRLT